MNKTLIVLSLLLVGNSKLVAQDADKSDFTAGITSFISWISDIDRVLTSINDKEKLKKLSRHLGDVSLDIENIRDGKILLANEIAKKDNLNDDTMIAQLDSQIREIQDDISDLLVALGKVKGLLNQTNQQEMDKIIEEIEAGFKFKKMVYLKDIRDYLFKKNMSYDKIKQESELSKQIAENASVSIKTARQKILLQLQK